MKRKGTVILAVLMIVLLTAALVACDPSGSQGGGGDGSAADTYTEVVTPYYLNVNNPTTNMSKYFVDEFSLDDITYSVVYKVERKNDRTGVVESTSTKQGTEKFTATVEVLENGDADLERLRTVGTHVIKIVDVVDGVRVSGSTKVYLKDHATTTYDVTVNFKSADGTGASVVKSLKEGVKISYGSSFFRQFGIPTSYTSVGEGGASVTRYLSHFAIANEAAIFAPAGTQTDVDVYDMLTVGAPITLTAVYSDSAKESYDFTFVINAPADIIWNYDAEAARDNVVASVVSGSRVSDIRLDSSYSSANYTLRYWKDADGNQFDCNGTRIYGDTTVTAVWEKKTFSASLSLTNGSIEPSYILADASGLAPVAAQSVFNSDGVLVSVTFGGIEYGTALNGFYADINLNKDGTTVKRVALSDLFDGKALVRSGYEFGYVYAKGEDVAYDGSVAVTAEQILTVSWLPDITNIDEQYYANTFEFEMLIDGTYAIKRVKDASATLIYVPAEYKGVPVTRISAGAAESKAMVTTLDLTSATNLRYIGENAFSGCVALTEIKSPEDGGALSYVAAGAFDGIGYNPYKSGHLIVGNVLVQAATDGLATLDLSQAGFKYIAGGAFNDTRLAKVILPDDLRGIADGAFVAVSTSFAIETATTSMEYLGADIGLGSFADNNLLDDACTIGNALYRYTGDEESLDLNVSGTTVIAGGAFRDAANLTSLTFDESKMVYIGENAFSNKFIAANVDENGFFVVNGILIKYYGSAKQVTLPADVVVINTTAFANSGLSNLIIPVGSGLTTIKENAFKNAGKLNVTVRAESSADEIRFSAEVNAFTNWTGGIYVEYYPAPNTSGTGGMSTQKLFADLFAGDNSAMWNWLRDNNKASAVEITSVEVDSKRIPNIFVTDANGEVDFFETAKVWNNDLGGNGVFADNGKYTVTSAVVIWRNDGLSSTEDFVMTQEDVKASFAKAIQDGANPDGDISSYDSYAGVLTVSAENTTAASDLIPEGGVSDDFDYVIYAGIAKVELKNAAGVVLGADDVLALYTTDTDSIKTNSVLSKCTLVVTYTNGAVEEYLLASYSTSVKMTGYSKEVTGDGTTRTLTFSYSKSDYRPSSTVVSSSGSVDVKYTMTVPVATAIKLAADVPVDEMGRYHAELNTAQQVYNTKLRFSLMYTDGHYDTVTLGSGYITLENFFTTTYGERQATATYRNGELTFSCTFDYFVDPTVQGDFTFAYVNANGEIIKDGQDAVAVGDISKKPANAVGVTVTKYNGTGTVAVAVPSVYKFTDADGNVLGTIDVVAIGDSAFKGGHLTSIMIPASIKSIGDGAFEDCTNLTKAYLSDASALESIGKNAFKGTVKLEAIDLTATKVTVISEGAFYNSGIEKANLGAVVTVEAMAFYNCQNLTAVTTVPQASITNVASKAFYYCVRLESTAGIASDATVAFDAFDKVPLA